MFLREDDRWTGLTAVEDDHADFDVTYSPENHSKTAEDEMRPGSPEIVLIKCELDEFLEETTETPHISTIAVTSVIYKCIDCDRVFNHQRHLTQHNQRWHSGDKAFKCCICRNHFSDEVIYKKHYIKHANEKLHQCDVCANQFTRKGDLRRHMILHTGRKPHACKICGKTFIRNDHKFKHMRTHEKKLRKQAQREFGKSMKVLSDNIINSNTSVHMQVTSIKDPLFDDSINSDTSSYTIEKSITHPLFNDIMHCDKPEIQRYIKERPHACQICDKRYMRIVHLNRHMRRKHENSRKKDALQTTKNQCREPSNGISYQDQDDTTYKEKSADKPHKCDLCPKRFAHQTGLIRHRHLHTSQKPYYCPTCGKGFMRKEYFRKHCENVNIHKHMK